MNRSGEYYEQKTASIMGQLHQGSVLNNVRIEGKLTKLKREIDVEVSLDSYDKLVLECKDQQAKVDIKEIEAWSAKLTDLESNKGAIVSNSGFTKGAIQAARAHNIDLLSIVDSKDPKIRTRIYTQFKMKTWYVESYYASGFKNKTPPSSLFSFEDPDKMQIIRNRISTSWIDVFKKYWNSHSLDLKNIKIGENEYILRNVTISDANNEQINIDQLIIRYVAKIKYFKQDIEILSTQGVFDIKHKLYTAIGSFKTDEISMNPNDWQLIKEDETESTQQSFIVAESKQLLQ